MKQIPKSAEITARLIRANGRDANLDNLVVYEAIAFNTRPVRKRHPLYKGAIANRGLLLEMAAQLERESVPLQIMHDGDVLPIGRAFHGEVIEKGTESELRVLFFVDKTSPGIIERIESGTIDQVSVSVLSKQFLCSACGFDYFGKDAGIEHVFSATCPEGHVLGENGVHAKMVGLDQWFELSLVGSGGAQNARIVGRDQSHFNPNTQRLAASGRDLDDFILTASAEESTGTKMELQALLDRLTTSTTNLANSQAEAERLRAQLAERDATITGLNARIAEAGEAATALQAKDTELADLKAKLEGADAKLRDVLTKVLTASGKVGETLPAELADVIVKIDEQSAALAAALANTNKSTAADAPDKDAPRAVSPFRIRRAR